MNLWGPNAVFPVTASRQPSPLASALQIQPESGQGEALASQQNVRARRGAVPRDSAGPSFQPQPWNKRIPQRQEKYDRVALRDPRGLAGSEPGAKAAQISASQGFPRSLSASRRHETTECKAFMWTRERGFFQALRVSPGGVFVRISPRGRGTRSRVAERQGVLAQRLRGHWLRWEGNSSHAGGSHSPRGWQGYSRLLTKGRPAGSIVLAPKHL